MKNLPLVVGLLSFSLVLSKPAQAFDSIYAFGDSLSDTGNIYTLSQGAIPPASFYGTSVGAPPINSSFLINPQYLLGLSTNPYIPNTSYLGRYSNGTNWLDDLSASLNIPLYDYAYGGANTDTTNIGDTASIQLPGLQTEVGLFDKTLGGGSADPNALYTVWAGANDLLNNSSPNASTSASNVATAVSTLAQLGAKNILVLNLPDLGTLPYAIELGTINPSYPIALSALSTEFNSDLSTDLSSLTSSVKLTQLDINTLFENKLSIYENSSTLQAKNCITNAPSYNYSTTHYVNGCNSSNENNYLFWDDVHPTSPIYSTIARAAITDLGVPEPLTILGSITALGMAIGLKHKLAQKN